MNISTEFISGTLTWGQVFSISGTLLAVWLARRFGQSKPLLIALASHGAYDAGAGGEGGQNNLCVQRVLL